MKAPDISLLFTEGKNLLFQSDWVNAAKTFYQIKNTALQIDDTTAAAMAGYWQAASEILAEDFGSAKSFKDLLSAYHHWMKVDPDDRNEAKLEGTVEFCEAWLYILGDRDAPSKKEVCQFRDSTEEAETTIAVAAHLASEFALCVSHCKPRNVELAKTQFSRFVSCIRNRSSFETLPQCLTESYGVLADRLDISVSAGTQNGGQTTFQPRPPRADDDSAFTHVSLQQCDRFYRSSVASLPATVTPRENVMGLLSIIIAWGGVAWLTIVLLGVNTVSAMLTLFGPLLGIIVGSRWLVRQKQYVLLIGIVAIIASSILMFTKTGSADMGESGSPPSVSSAATDELKITKVRPIVDEPTLIRDFADTGLMSLYWELILSNNGEKDISVIDYDVLQVLKEGPISYTDLRQGLYSLQDTKFQPIKLPLVIPAGHSSALFIRLGVMMDRKAYAMVRDEFDGKQPQNASSIIDFLRSREIDVYGNPFTKSDIGIYSLPPLNEIQDPVFCVTFKTARNAKISELISWYKYGFYRLVTD